MVTTTASAAPHFPKSAPAFGVLGVGAQGVMSALKEFGIQLPPTFVLVVGILSALAVLFAILQIISWGGHSIYAQIKTPNSGWHYFLAGTRRKLIPLMLGAMALAGLILIAAAVAGALSYYANKSDVAFSGAQAAAPSGNPLQDAINAFLAKQGKIASYSPFGGTVSMADESDGTGPYIASWHASLGSWPAVADGFTAEQLRRSPNIIPTPLSRPLSAYEADLKVKVIDKVLEILSNDMEPIVAKGVQLKSGAWNAFKDPKNHPTYGSDLLAYRDSFKQSVEKLDALRSQNPQYRDIVVASQQTCYHSCLRGIENFLITYQHLSTYLKEDVSNEVFSGLMKLDVEAFDKAIQDFTEWRNRARQRVLELRRQISP